MPVQDWMGKRIHRKKGAIELLEFALLSHKR